MFHFKHSLFRTDRWLRNPGKNSVISSDPDITELSLFQEGWSSPARGKDMERHIAIDLAGIGTRRRL